MKEVGAPLLLSTLRRRRGLRLPSPTPRAFAADACAAPALHETGQSARTKVRGRPSPSMDLVLVSLASHFSGAVELRAQVKAPLNPAEKGQSRTDISNI